MSTTLTNTNSAKQGRKKWTVEFFLNAALCQSPPEISKTQKAINYIKHFSIISRARAGPSENGIHHITVVLTNCNLSETKQWKTRLGKKLDHLNVVVLSSKKDSDARSIDQLLRKMGKVKSASQLPDLIVMCTHAQRCDDLYELIDTFKTGNYDWSGRGVNQISMTIMFDEADKNIKLVSTCLTELDKLLTVSSSDIKVDDVIRDVHFITATPLGDFWKKLKKCGIEKLKNVNQALKSLDVNSELHCDYNELMKGYRYLDDHTRSHLITDMNDDTQAYVEKVLPLRAPPPETPLIVYAPSGHFVANHESMKDMLLQRGYHVYLDNGQFKGFCSPDTSVKVRTEDFNRKHNVSGELMNTLVKWKQLNPGKSLVITGCRCITRGITFNTIGFNFTDLILSAFHMKDVAELIQAFGRGNGGKDYVQKMTIHCPEPVWTFAMDTIDRLDELYKKDPAEFEERDFRAGTKKDRQLVAMTVPYVFHVGPENWTTAIKKVGKSKKYDDESIFAEIAKHDKNLVNLLKTNKDLNRWQVTCPDPNESPTTYKKNVTDFIDKFKANKPYIAGKYEHNSDGYQIMLDQRDHNIIVSLYYGSKIKNDDDEEETESVANTIS